MLKTVNVSLHENCFWAKRTGEAQSLTTQHNLLKSSVKAEKSLIMKSIANTHTDGRRPFWLMERAWPTVPKSILVISYKDISASNVLFHW